MSESIPLDAIDQRILAALQRDARLSFEQLAERVGLSSSAVLRRVRRLEGDGVICGYSALVAPERVGLGLSAYINVRLEKHGATQRQSPSDQFRAAVQGWAEVVDCVALARLGNLRISFIDGFACRCGHYASASLTIMSTSSS